MASVAQIGFTRVVEVPYSSPGITTPEYLRYERDFLRKDYSEEKVYTLTKQFYYYEGIDQDYNIQDFEQNFYLFERYLMLDNYVSKEKLSVEYDLDPCTLINVKYQCSASMKLDDLIHYLIFHANKKITSLEKDPYNNDCVVFQVDNDYTRISWKDSNYYKSDYNNSGWPTFATEFYGQSQETKINVLKVLGIIA